MKIFVYGSLMDGFYNFDKYLTGKVINRYAGKTKGTLYHLSNKGYPGLVLDGDNDVYGEIIEIADEDTMIDLDILENYVIDNESNNAYNRTKIRVENLETKYIEDLQAYVYVTDSDRNINDNRIIIKCGCWRTYMDNK